MKYNGCFVSVTKHYMERRASVWFPFGLEGGEESCAPRIVCDWNRLRDVWRYNFYALCGYDFNMYYLWCTLLLAQKNNPLVKQEKILFHVVKEDSSGCWKLWLSITLRGKGGRADYYIAGVPLGKSHFVGRRKQSFANLRKLGCVSLHRDAHANSGNLRNHNSADSSTYFVPLLKCAIHNYCKCTRATRNGTIILFASM